MQTQAVEQYQAHDKPGGGDITSKSKKTLGDQKPEEIRNGSVTQTRHSTVGSHMCGLTVKLSFF